MLDAIRAYEEGVGSIAEIDEAMKAGAGHPMGPLTLADFVGLDTMGAICDVLFDEFRERRFARPPMLRKMLVGGLVRPQVRHGLLRLLGRGAGPEPRDLMRPTARAAAPAGAPRPADRGGRGARARSAWRSRRSALDDELPIGVHLADPRARGGRDPRAGGCRRGRRGRRRAYQSVLLVGGLRAARAGAADARRRARRRLRRRSRPARVDVDLAACSPGAALWPAAAQLVDLRADRRDRRRRRGARRSSTGSSTPTR